MKRNVVASDAILLLAAMIWGFAFVAQRVGMEHCGPFTFNGIRFALGAVILIPLLTRKRVARRRERNRDSMIRPVSKWWCFLAGIVLFGGASLQQIGIMWTTAGKAGFITGLYVVLVPILDRLRGNSIGWGTWVGAVLALCGLFLLAGTGSFSLGLGDTLVLLGAVFWSFHVLIIGSLSTRTDPYLLAITQFATCSGLSLVSAVLTEQISATAIAAAAIPIAYGGFMSVGFAYTMQILGQRHAPPSHAAILLSLETVFAAFGGWLLLSEVLTGRALLGCSCMLAGMILSQVMRGVGMGRNEPTNPVPLKTL